MQRILEFVIDHGILRCSVFFSGARAVLVLWLKLGNQVIIPFAQFFGGFGGLRESFMTDLKRRFGAKREPNPQQNLRLLLQQCKPHKQKCWVLFPNLEVRVGCQLCDIDVMFA